MNSKRVIVAMLLMGSITLSAKEDLLLKKESTSEQRSTALQFRKKQPRDLFKLNTSFLRSGSPARDWDFSEVTGGGLFINLGLHFPSAKFLNPYYESGDARYRLGFDFELGSFFRFAKINDGQFGIGLRATWLSLSYTSMTDGSDLYRAAQISVVRLGPQFSMAIDEQMGFDVFYQIGGNFTDQFGAIDDPINDEDVGFNSIYVGVSHEVGAAYHFRVFSLGFGYRFGKLKNISNIYDGEDMGEDWLDDKKSSVGNFRVTLGFKF